MIRREERRGEKKIEKKRGSRASNEEGRGNLRSLKSLCRFVGKSMRMTLTFDDEYL